MSVRWFTRAGVVPGCYFPLRGEGRSYTVLGVVPVDGVLLDIEMPVLDGLTLLRELQQQHIHVPVIVMSAGNDPKKFMKAVELGALDYLNKPINSVLLALKCERLFG